MAWFETTTAFRGFDIVIDMGWSGLAIGLGRPYGDLTNRDDVDGTTSADTRFTDTNLL